MPKQILLPLSRRSTARVNALEGVWVYWQCNTRCDTSRVRDLSLAGLFIETRTPEAVGSTVKLDFLVQEGQIRAEATVQRAEPGQGLGLKFNAVNNDDRSHLASMLNRLRNLSR